MSLRTEPETPFQALEEADAPKDHRKVWMKHGCSRVIGKKL